MEQRSLRLRWLVVWVLAVVWMAAVLARLSYLQLFQYSEYFARAQRQQQRTFEISPKRGTIYDRKGRELAVSLPMDSVFADPSDVSDPEMVARLLGRVLDVPAEELETKIRAARTPVRLAKKMAPDSVERIEAMNLRGVFFQKENRRVYPQRELAAHVLGYVDVDEKGIGGIEHSLDKLIRGRPGRIMVMADGRRHWYDRNEAAANPGAGVVLSIDETIQYIAEKELAQAIAQTHAKNGVVVVQDPNSGELLAMANWPTFDPNDAGTYPDEVRMNRAVSAAYEPGSTFKLITLAGALENGITNPNEMIDCQMGSILVAGRLIHDHKPFGVLSVRDVLAQSSDVGTIKIALRLGGPKFYQVIRDFDIGEPTGIELPGENRGLMRPIENWSANSIGSLAMGQEVSATPVQMISAVSAIANGGQLYRPRVVHEIRGNATDSLREHPEPTQATDPKTAATLREMMETVILEGTGKRAKLDGYTAAGKSGTAQKIDPETGRYSRNEYIASFVGFAPVNQPVLTILVVLDSPVGEHFGGDVGGPVFKRIAEQALAYLDVGYDIPLPEGTETAKNAGRGNGAAAKSASAASEEAAKEKFDALAKKNGAGGTGAPTVAFGEDGAAEVPDLAGTTVRRAIEQCSELGLEPLVLGNGVAVEQSPRAGMQVARGTRVMVRFGRAGELVPVGSKTRVARGAGN
jgi:cell division protein FtsI (penicillin-binding protein 3)